MLVHCRLFEQTSPTDTESNPQWVEGNAGSVYEWANSLAKWTNSYKGGDGLDELVVGDFLQVDADSKPSIYVKPNFGYAISKIRNILKQQPLLLSSCLPMSKR